MGSGMIIGKDTIIANAHVVEGARELEITGQNKRVLNAKVVGSDPPRFSRSTSPAPASRDPPRSRASATGGPEDYAHLAGCLVGPAPHQRAPPLQIRNLRLGESQIDP